MRTTREAALQNPDHGVGLQSDFCWRMSQGRTPLLDLWWLHSSATHAYITSEAPPACYWNTRSPALVVDRLNSSRRARVDAGDVYCVLMRRSKRLRLDTLVCTTKMER